MTAKPGLHEALHLLIVKFEPSNPGSVQYCNVGFDGLCIRAVSMHRQHS